MFRNYTTIAVDHDTHKMLRMMAAAQGTNIKDLVAKIVSDALKKERQENETRKTNNSY